MHDESRCVTGHLKIKGRIAYFVKWSLLRPLLIDLHSVLSRVESHLRAQHLH